MEIGAEAALFPEKEYISGIFVAVWDDDASNLCSDVKHLVEPCMYFRAGHVGFKS